MYIECTTSKHRNIFVVRLLGREAVVYNSLYFSTDTEELNDFNDYLFSEYRVTKIRWRKLYEPLPPTRYRRLSLCTISDNIAVLPTTYSDYLNSLGKQTKKHSKYYIGRIGRDYPSVEYRYMLGRELPRPIFHRICDMARGRMQCKSMTYGSNDDNLWHSIQHKSGFAYVVSIDGVAMAACIGYILGVHLYLVKIAHDVEFNRYNLGNIVLLKLIEYCIDHNVRYFHFLWGEGVDYKVRYGGLPHRLTDYIFYRKSNLSYFLDAVSITSKSVMHMVANKLRKMPFIVKAYHRVRMKLK